MFQQLQHVLNNEPPPTVVVGEVPSRLTAGRNRRVLVVDDHLVFRLAAGVLLEPLASIDMAENGRIAIDLTLAARFDAVLMDIQMPVLDGLSAVREIRRQEALLDLPATPIIMFTSHSGRDAEYASFAAGADFHLAKPSPEGTLIAAVVEAFRLRDARQAT